VVTFVRHEASIFENQRFSNFP